MSNSEVQISNDIKSKSESEKNIFEALTNKQPIPVIIRGKSDSENRKKDFEYFFNLDIIKKYLNNNYNSNYELSDKQQDENEKTNYTLRLENILNKIDDAFIIIIEPVYIDKLYRDSYYHFHSEKLNNTDRNCLRLSLYYAEGSKGLLFESDKLKNGKSEYYISYHEYIKKIEKKKKQKKENSRRSDSLMEKKENEDENIDYLFVNNFYEYSYHDKIQDAIIGTITLRPLVHHSIGRVILDPTKLPIQKCYLRLAETTVAILGQLYKLLYYPFSGQDMEFISCAEVSIWTIFEYFGRRYSEYRSVLPHEFMEDINGITSERTLPTRGLNYQYKSKILKDFGFYPLVYTREVFEKKFTFGARDFKNIFHCYVESGIPIAMTLAKNKESSDRHAVICIGHGDLNYENIKKASFAIKYHNTDVKKTNNSEKQEEYFEINFLNSSDLSECYCLIDDNMIPYKFDRFDDFSLGGLSLQAFIAPLNKKIYIDAAKALKVFNELIEVTSMQIKDYLENYLEKSSKLTNITSICDIIVIRRMFLTSSRKYAAFKVQHAPTVNEKRFYASIPYPRFLWIMELGTKDQYKGENDGSNKRVFAEYILDATSNSIEYLESAILIRVGKNIGYKLFDENVYDDVDVSQKSNCYNSFRITTRFFAKEGKGINDEEKEGDEKTDNDFEYEFDMYENNLINVKEYKKGDYNYGG